MGAAEQLEAGVAILTPAMYRHGFSFASLGGGEGSGGDYAAGEFRKQAGELRRLELHFRQALGLVAYHLGDITISHSDYMRALEARNRYPGFSSDPLDGFRHLLDDVERYAHDFLEGSGSEFKHCAEHAARRAATPGFKRLSQA
jgi:hypothetical protein